MARGQGGTQLRSDTVEHLVDVPALNEESRKNGNGRTVGIRHGEAVTAPAPTALFRVTAHHCGFTELPDRQLLEASNEL